MSSFEEAGFLSEQIKEWIEEHRKENSNWFDLCEGINKYLHKTLITIKDYGRDIPKRITASLYIKAISNFQGVVIMTERGMPNEAKSLSRCLLENLFAVVAIEKDRNTARLINSDFLLKRKNYLKRLRKYKVDNDSVMFVPSTKKIDRMLQDNETEIKK